MAAQDHTGGKDSWNPGHAPRTPTEVLRGLYVGGEEFRPLEKVSRPVALAILKAAGDYYRDPADDRCPHCGHDLSEDS